MSMKDDIEITFDPQDVEFDYKDRMQFWESTREWLLHRGYRLYKMPPFRPPFIQNFPSMPNHDRIGGEYPYAFHDPETGLDDCRNLWGESHPSYSVNSEGRVTYAQDLQNRHVAIKLVGRNTDEARICQLLLDERTSKPGAVIPGVVPIFDVIPFGGHWLVVMPRWGTVLMRSWFRTVGDVLTFIRQMLQGLEFLHRHRIIHRDLTIYNALVNHFPRDYVIDQSDKFAMRLDLQANGHIRYAWFDFGYSILLPATTPLNICRLPYTGTHYGTWDGPHDVQQGEYDYNPFAYDVGCVGRSFCGHFQHLTPQIPMLAPFLDRMVTRDIGTRFSAAQALEFFEEMVSNLDATQLAVVPAPLSSMSMTWTYDEYDRWAGLSEDFVKRWGHLREPPIPTKIKLLRFICQYRWAASMIRFVRRTVDAIVKR